MRRSRHDKTLKKESMKKKQIINILLAISVCAAEFAVTALYLYPLVLSGDAVAASKASEDLPGILKQGFVLLLFPLLLFILFASMLKKDFAEKMYLKLEGKWQRISAAALCLITLVITAYCLTVKEDRISVLFALPYYFILVAFSEEFVCRDVCTYFLRDAKWPVRYLVPGICFSMLHLFSYSGWRSLTGTDITAFFSGGFLGFVAFGCLMQYLKEKSGTIWLPVLLHGLLDFTTVFTYN